MGPAERIRKIRAERARLAAKKEPAIKAAIRRCFSTEDGKHVLFFLKELCGWDAPAVSGNPEIAADVLHGTFYNETRREVYADLRQLIPIEILREVEFYKPSHEGEED